MALAERRHALVTGGGRGIGRAIAVALSQSGIEVTVLGRDTQALQAVVHAGAAAGLETADVTDAEALRAAIVRVTDARGPLDILVNNAGGVESAPFARLDRAAWDACLALNLTAVYEACHAVLPSMVARRQGRIVNIASTAGLIGYPYVAAYVAAKHGVVGLTRALALEAARSGVTVNAVCPGFTDTDLIERSASRTAGQTGKPVEEIRAVYTRANPQGRLVLPEEVAATVLFLCGSGASAINGQSIAVAGGEVM